MHSILKKWRWGILPVALAAMVVAFLAFSSYTTSKASATTVVGPWKTMGTFTDQTGSPKPVDRKLIKFTPASGTKTLKPGMRVRLSTQPGIDWIVVEATDSKTDTPLLIKMGGYVYMRPAVAGDACAALADPTFAANTVYVAACGAPAPTGPLSGPSDIMVTAANKLNDAYHCIANTAQAGALAKTQAVCFDNTGVLALLSPAGNEPPTGIPVGEGPDICTPAGTGTCIGPPPPPPYPNGSPAQGAGTYNAGTDTLVTTTCFADAGASLNIISTLTIGPGTNPNNLALGALAQIGAFGKQEGNVDIWLHQSIAACNTLTPAGPIDLANLHTNIYPIGNAACPGGAGGCIQSPYRMGHSLTDYDADGCTDVAELTSAGADYAGAKCGDDPWNPYDSVVNATGAYDILAIAKRADVGAGAPAYAPGFYYECNSDHQLDGTSGGTWVGLTVRLNCYIDQPNITINAHKAAGSSTLGVSTCTGTLPSSKFCGDGFSGSMPPGCNPKAIAPDLCSAHLPPNCPSLPCDVSVWQFSNVTNKVVQLTGVLDSNTNSVIIEGCYNDPQAINPLGAVYIQAAFDLHTGSGFAFIWPNLTDAACKAKDVSAHPVPGVLSVFLVKQAPGAKATINRDSDGDGCPDKKELGSSQTAGGLRDPSNRWDYFNPEKTNTPVTQTVADILKTVTQFGKNQGNVNYQIGTDRTGLIGGNAWNLGPPDGQQTVADILAAVKQFGHNCGP